MGLTTVTVGIKMQTLGVFPQTFSPLYHGYSFIFFERKKSTQLGVKRTPFFLFNILHLNLLFQGKRGLN